MELAYLLVVLGVIFLYFQLILGRICRWSSSWFVRKGAEASYNLSNLVATVALGLMPKEHSAAVWILYLTVLNNSLAAYDRENELLHLWTGVNVFLFCLRTVRTVGRAGLHGAAGPLAYVLVVAMVLASAYCKIVIALASSSKRYSEEVVAYMKRLKDRRNLGQYYNATTLAGYRYAVTLDPLTTVEQIYTQNLDEEAGGHVEQRRRKDLCLSFALFRLLFRRYHGLPCDEADLLETCKLVTEGLLVPLPQQGPEAAGDEYRRVFRVAEVELGFLHDHIHGGYVLWSREHRVCYRIIVLLKAFLMYVASPVLYIAPGGGGPGPGRRAPAALYSLSAREFVTLVFLHLFFDLLQIIFYYRSDRWMVSYVCRSHTHTQGRQNRLRRMMAFLHKYRLACCNVYWQNRVGQYSLLGETTRRTASGAITTFLRQQTWDWYWDSRCARQSAPVRLPRRLRASIALGLLRATRNGTLDLAGVPSLGRDHGLPRGEVRCDPNTHKVQVILKWHIATSYCEMKLRRDGELPQVAGLPCYEVAGTLSRYCAYLVAFRPELLPCPDEHTKDTFRRVLAEVIGLEGGHLPNEDRFHTLDNRRSNPVNVPGLTVTLSDGLDLGHLLLGGIPNRRLLWVILQNVWVKLILSVAPQESLGATCAKHHAKCLAQGGEFVTQLWAILSHAGILKQSSWPLSQVHGGQGGRRFIDELRRQYEY